MDASRRRDNSATSPNAPEAAFSDHYIRPKGTIHSDAETPYALAIVFGLLDPEDKQFAGKRLAELVTESGFHIRTGFAGTPFFTMP